jgi:hypothetical protein
MRANGVWTIPALKEYVDQRFAASETATVTALSSAEKAVSAALIAAEKAVEKAEAAQRRVNETQNEFRGTLKDQAADLMPRVETELLVKELDGKIDNLRQSRDQSGGEQRGARATTDAFWARAAVIGVAAGLLGHYIH